MQSQNRFLSRVYAFKKSMNIERGRQETMNIRWIEKEKESIKNCCFSTSQKWEDMKIGSYCICDPDLALEFGTVSKIFILFGLASLW